MCATDFYCPFAKGAHVQSIGRSPQLAVLCLTPEGLLAAVTATVTEPHAGLFVLLNERALCSLCTWHSNVIDCVASRRRLADSLSEQHSKRYLLPGTQHGA